MIIIREWDTLFDGLTDAELELYFEAAHVAEVAHEGQTYGPTEAYHMHCLRVGWRLLHANEPTEIVVAGILHDTLEDTEVTYDDLRKSFGSIVANLVAAVTRNKEKETYAQYISRVNQVPLARVVKRADLLENINVATRDKPEALPYRSLLSRWMKAYIELLGENNEKAGVL